MINVFFFAAWKFSHPANITCARQQQCSRVHLSHNESWESIFTPHLCNSYWLWVKATLIAPRWHHDYRGTVFIIWCRMIACIQCKWINAVVQISRFWPFFPSSFTSLCMCMFGCCLTAFNKLNTIIDRKKLKLKTRIKSESFSMRSLIMVCECLCVSFHSHPL